MSDGNIEAQIRAVQDARDFGGWDKESLAKIKSAADRWNAEQQERETRASKAETKASRYKNSRRKN